MIRFILKYDYVCSSSNILIVVIISIPISLAIIVVAAIIDITIVAIMAVIDTRLSMSTTGTDSATPRFA